MCFASTVVAFWFFTQEVAGSNPFTVMTNIFVTEFSDFSEALRKNFTVQLDSVPTTYTEMEICFSSFFGRL